MKLCIIGTGYVGLVGAACFAEMGNTVRCVDANPAVVDGLNAGRVHIFEPGLEDFVQRNHAEGRLVFTTSLAEGIDGAELAFICVGTPPCEDGSCDLGHVEAVARDIGRIITGPIIVVNKSTVPVGAADRVRAIICRELATRDLEIEFDVVSNPEFLKEGDAIMDFIKPDRVVVGTENEHSAEVMRALYAPFARSREKVIVMGTRSAEMTKYAANCMLATKISFINEIASICEHVGANVSEVRTGIGSDSRIGYQFIYPGVGYGGSCFPKDIRALIYTARANGFTPELLESVDAVNDRQKHSMARKIAAHFDGNSGVSGKTLAVWGLAFKANTDDMREAASITIINDLTAQGMRVRAYDPVAAANARKIFKNNSLVAIMDEQYKALEGADALLVVTEWNQFRTPDFARVKAMLSSPVVFDGRNLYPPSLLAKQGFCHYSVGR